MSSGTYYVNGWALKALERDAIGWNHNADCGCFREDKSPREGWLKRMMKRKG